MGPGVLSAPMNRWYALAATLTVLLVACGGQSSSSETTSPSSFTTTPPLPSSTTISVPSTTVASFPEPITAEQAPVVAVSEREQGRWLITWGPDWLAFGFGSLWVKRDNGTVLRIDPATGDLQAEIELGPGLCQGIGVGLAVWACSRETSDGPVSWAQIDPRHTNALVATYEVDKSSDQGRLLTVDDRVWVLSGGDRLLGVATDGTISDPIELGMFCTDLASDGHTLWVTCSSPGLAARVDLASGAVTDRIELPRAWAADLGEYLWVGFQGGLGSNRPAFTRSVGRIRRPWCSPRCGNRGGRLGLGPDSRITSTDENRSNLSEFRRDDRCARTDQWR